jgi:hypothetical protein
MHLVKAKNVKGSNEFRNVAMSASDKHARLSCQHLLKIVLIVLVKNACDKHASLLRHDQPKEQF